MEIIEIIDNNATLLYMQVLVNNHWNYYYPGLNTFEWIMAQWIKFIAETFITFSIREQPTYDKDTQGRIINELSVKWNWF
jgi:hypothetical protein